ncbi:3-oxoacyl-[acyl-carrier-protein] reductase [bacterium]|nr:3-oxoacyl-[acyl-carrier-protein] reductase [bacterium]
MIAKSDFPNSRKVALVTGAARGIGLEISKVLCDDGFDIVLSDINADGLEIAKKEFENVDRSVWAISADISKLEEAERLIDETVKKFGKLDVLVNNAGITKDALLLRMKEDQWDAVINVNLKGTFLVTRASCKQMLKQKSGNIVSIASVIGLIGNAGQANYAASKAGIIAFTKSIAKEFAAKGIRANAVAPGFIKSEMTDVLAEKVKDQMLSLIPMARLGLQRDVANVVSFLVSEKSSYITGQVLTVDGGMVMV